ncbi:MAG: metallophosphoesterase family protein [Polyangiales bacterium]
MESSSGEIRDTMVQSTPHHRVRIAAVGDIHCIKVATPRLRALFETVHEGADVLLLCGDLTDHGTVEEAHALAREVAHARVPVLAVLGNHDHEAGCPDRVAGALGEVGVNVLDGEGVEVCGIGFAGVKGFLGGFGRGTLGAWGEAAVKAFVQAAIDEELKLESALAHLGTERKVALMHYAPVEATCVGENPVLYPYLGCSRLEEPLMRNPVEAVFHGHAHKGTREGKTASGIPVFNVAMPLLLAASDRPYLVYEI